MASSKSWQKKGSRVRDLQGTLRHSEDTTQLLAIYKCQLESDRESYLRLCYLQCLSECGNFLQGLFAGEAKETTLCQGPLSFADDIPFLLVWVASPIKNGDVPLHPLHHLGQLRAI